MSEVATDKKPWFRIDQPNKTKDVVEYSTDFKFFSENQILIWRSGKRYTFTSRLEARKFGEKLSVNRKGELSPTEIVLFTRQIHQEILQGKHGSGKLVE